MPEFSWIGVSNSYAQYIPPHPVTLTSHFKEDIQWFIDFLVLYNGKAIIRSFVQATIILEVDACLVGGGGVWLDHGYFFYIFPHDISSRDLHISALECLNVLVALRVWQTALSGSTVQVNCDNAATVTALASGKSACPAMTDVLRETWALCSVHDIMLLPQHKPREHMHTPDLLSRAYRSETNWRKLANFRESTNLRWYPVPPAATRYPSCHWKKPSHQYYITYIFYITVFTRMSLPPFFTRPHSNILFPQPQTNVDILPREAQAQTAPGKNH